MKKKRMFRNLGRLFILSIILTLIFSFLVYSPSFGALTWTGPKINKTLNSVLASDPTDANVFYFGTCNLPGTGDPAAAQGLWKSVDKGNTWTQINDGTLQDSYNISAILVDPTNGNYVYVGTFIQGFFRSANGGTSWTAVNTGYGSQQAKTGTAGLAYSGGALYAGKFHAFELSTSVDGAGLFKLSNAQTGTSWSEITPSGVYKNIGSVVASGSRVYFATASIHLNLAFSLACLNQDGTLRYSDNGGSSWTEIKTGLAWGSNDDNKVRAYLLAADPNSSNICYCTTNVQDVSTSGATPSNEASQGLYKWSGSGNWTKIKGGPGGVSTKGYLSPAFVDKSSGTIWIGESLSDGTPYNQCIQNSIDGGNTWVADASGIPDNQPSPAFFVTHQSNSTPVLASIKFDGDSTKSGVWKGAEQANTNPSVTGVTASQDTSGIVNISYTVTDNEQSTVTIAFKASTNGGSSWFDCTTTTGEGSTSIGSGKTGNWTAMTDIPGIYVTNARIRVEADDGAGGTGSGDSPDFILDTIPPGPYNKSVVINSGAAYATSTSATLTLSCTDTKGSSPGVTEMMIANNASFSGASWEPYNTSKSWTLASGEGTKTVYAKFKDGDGNESAAASDSIILDLNAPTGSVSINGGAATCSNLNVTLSLPANDGAGSGLDKMMVSNSSSFSGASWEAYAASKSWALTSGGDGTRTVYAKFKDKAGRESSSVSDNINYIADSVAPSNPSVIVNNGDGMTRSLNVTLSLSATDNVGVTEMMVSNDANLTGAAKEAYAATKSWTFTGTAGDKTVYAKFFDAAGNPSSAASDSISYVTTKSITRLAGNDRYLTAIEISKAGWPKGAQKVVLARGDMFPDALAGGTLAAKEGAPILLTTSGSLYQATSDEIKRLKATGAIILGGEGAVSAQVVADLKSKNGMGDANIKRYGGANRYETGSLIAKALINPPANKTAIIATGENYPDALASASLAAYLKMPIILIGKSSVPSGAQDALKALGINKTIIVGGEGVVDATAASWLSSNGYPATRLAGSDRYGTAEKIAEYALANGLKADVMTVATGENFPDALAAGPFAGAKKAAIVLVRKTSIPEGTSKVLNDNKSNIWSVYIAGGTGVVSEDVKADIGKIIGAK